MSNQHKCLIRTGQNIGQIATGRTITLSWKAKADVLIIMQPAGNEEQCRLSQLKLAWMWATDVAQSGLGSYDTKEDCYWEFKVRFLAPTLAAADEEFAQLWESLGAYNLLGNKQLYRQMSDRFISHNDCTVTQVSEALSEWERVMLDHGIQLRQPDEYRFALQIESYQQDTTASQRAA